MGWLKLHRRITDWKYFRDGNMLRLWLYLLCEAAYKPCEVDGVELQRGDILVSYATISEELDMTPKQVRTCLEKLVEDEQITKQSARLQTGGRAKQRAKHRAYLMTLVSICNYDTYQVEEDTEGQNIGQNIGQSQQEERNKERKKFPHTPSNKERKIKKEEQDRSREENLFTTTTSAYVRACPRDEDVEGVWLADLLGDAQRMEALCMRHHITREQVCAYAESFSHEQTAKGIRHQSREDLARHFVDWLRIQLQYGNNRTSNNTAATRAERIERTYAPIVADFLRRADADLALRRQAELHAGVPPR